MNVKGNWKLVESVKLGHVITDGQNIICESVRTAGIGHLISAAPDMYRALQSCDGALAMHGYLPEDERRVVVRAALAKAEGREA